MVFFFVFFFMPLSLCHCLGVLVIGKGHTVFTEGTDEEWFGYFFLPLILALFFLPLSGRQLDID